MIMDIERMKIFVELVKAGAGARAYKKRLNFTLADVNMHLPKFDEYKKVILVHETPRAKPFTLTPEQIKKLTEGPKTPNDDYYDDDDTIPGPVEHVAPTDNIKNLTEGYTKMIDLASKVLPKASDDDDDDEDYEGEDD